MKEIYLTLMEKTLSAYPDAHIRAYTERVKTEGLKEHGFPRLTANIGILISHGRRTELLPLFCEMMDLCCAEIPRGGAANDFSVKEILVCLRRIEACGMVNQTMLTRWKAALRTITPDVCYDKFARTPTDRVNNWACFTMVSEWLRHLCGLTVDDSATEAFVDLQLENQLAHLDENGMYRDPHEPMVYDLVSRGLFALLLHFGYRGKFYPRVDDCLRRAGLPTLQMQSVTGEIPFGGRSAQFLFNEALFAIVCEYEASRYAKEGDPATAARFKQGIALALENIALWLDHPPIRHRKNAFPLENHYGCEKYAYFDKYMITTASYLYTAYLLCDDRIAAEGGHAPIAETFATSACFHKLCLRSGDYFLEFDTNADPNYDASGLGRVHRRHAPSAICLSLPCPSSPKYEIDQVASVKASLCPGIREGDDFVFATDENQYDLLTHDAHPDSIPPYAEAELCCRFPNDQHVPMRVTVHDSGVDLFFSGRDEIACLLPAFSFDGDQSSAITPADHTLEISYRGWVCRYTTDGTICDRNQIACNRNGHYHLFAACGKNTLHVRIEIFPCRGKR